MCPVWRLLQYIIFWWRRGCFEKGREKIFIIGEKKFGGNITSLIFALPKRNKGSMKERGLGN
jgi:hypothetical protein